MLTNSKLVVPRATRRNPFKAGSALARQFDGIMQAYATGHRDVIRAGVRCMGNGWAVPFWKGYDGLPPYVIPRDSLAWACYRAGQAQRLLDNERGVFIPPRTNSIVGLKDPTTRRTGL